MTYDNSCVITDMGNLVSTKVTEGGRIVIPSDLRKQLGIEIGESVNLTIENGALTVMTRKQALRRAQAMVRKYVPEGFPLADELIADRREEAANE